MKLQSFFYIFAVFLLLCVQNSSAQNFPQSVINEMATRRMRYHHYLWHQVRENWNRFDSATQSAFRNIGWAPPRPARTFDSSGNAIAINDNNSGEDFLYMHRQMIATANSILARNNDTYGRVTGWTTIPAPGDRTYPVPGTYTVTGSSSTTDFINTRKTNSYYYNNIVPQERFFKDPVQLRRMTLGELGARIEVTIHSWLHMRFSASSSYGYRNSYRGTIPYIDKRWDNVQYNWLGDSYSSHVNPVFWKIHGWVDDRIEDWRRANGLSSITWRGTWRGGPMSNLDSVLRKEGSSGNMMDMDMGMEMDDDNSVMEEALQIFLKSGVPETSMTDEVLIDPLPKLKVKTRKVCKVKKNSKGL